MTMKTDEVILGESAKDGSVDVEGWPDLLNRLLARLDNIAHENFPAPTATELAQQPPKLAAVEPESDTQPDRPPSLSQTTAQDCVEDHSSQATQPDHPVPASVPAPASGDPSPAPASSDPSPALGGDGAAEAPLLPRIHPHDAATLAALKHILTTTFAAAPPHTVQRLSELLLSPNTHYKALPKFLRALTRVLSVASATTSFPIADQTVVFQNGFGGLGSDESLGGALLTPVPWLNGGSGDGVVEGIEVVGAGGGGAAGGAGGSGGAGGAGGAGGGGGSDSHALSPEATVAPRGVPPLDAEDVGPQPRGTVFPDPPGSMEEVRREREEGGEGGRGGGGRGGGGGGGGGGEGGGEGREEPMADVPNSVDTAPTTLKEKGEADEVKQGESMVVDEPVKEGEGMVVDEPAKDEEGMVVDEPAKEGEGMVVDEPAKEGSGKE